MAEPGVNGRGPDGGESEPDGGYQAMGGSAARAAGTVVFDPWAQGRRRLSEFEPERVEWLWQGRIPMGKLAILEGDPGTGKSTLTLDLAARVTRGLEMPGEPQSEYPAAGVVLWSAEDGLSDTIRPRLDAAGGDAKLVVVREFVAVERFRRELPTIEDIEALRSDIADVNGKLVIIDPLMAFIGLGTNTYQDQQVRQALSPLATLAEETMATIVVVRHLRKGQGGKAIYAGGGSIGIAAAARSVLLCGRDPDRGEDGSMVLAHSKSNLSKLSKSLAYRMLEEGGATRISWEGDSPHTAESLLKEARTGSAVGEAREFLAELLEGGPVAAEEAKAAAWRAGIAEGTLRRAKDELGVRSKKSSVRGGWNWVAPAQRAQESPR